jgi:hypothetical protein
VTRRYEFLRVEAGLRQVLRNAIKSLIKTQKKQKTQRKRAKNRVKTSERYVTGKGGVKPFVTERYIG